MARKGIKKYKSLRAQLTVTKGAINETREALTKLQHYEAFIFNCYGKDRTIEITNKNYKVIPVLKFAGVRIMENIPSNPTLEIERFVDSPSLHFQKKQIDRDYNENVMGEKVRTQSVESMRHFIPWENEDNLFDPFFCNEKIEQ